MASHTSFQREVPLTASLACLLAYLFLFPTTSLKAGMVAKRSERARYLIHFHFHEISENAQKIASGLKSLYLHEAIGALQGSSKKLGHTHSQISSDSMASLSAISCVKVAPSDYDHDSEVESNQSSIAFQLHTLLQLCSRFASSYSRKPLSYSRSLG